MYNKEKCFQQENVHMKKTLALLMCLSAILTLSVGCKSKKTNPKPDDASAPSQSQSGDTVGDNTDGTSSHNNSSLTDSELKELENWWDNIDIEIESGDGNVTGGESTDTDSNESSTVPEGGTGGSTEEGSGGSTGGSGNTNKKDEGWGPWI